MKMVASRKLTKTELLVFRNNRNGKMENKNNYH